MSEARLAACKEKAYGILAIVFVAGLASGVLGVRALDRQAAPAVVDSPVEEQTTVAIERLNRDLDLTIEQQQQLEMILDQHIMMEADLLARMRALQQQGRSEIIEVLTPEQRAKFELLATPVSTAP